MQNIYQIEVFNPYSDTGQCKAILLTELLTSLKTEGTIEYKQFSEKVADGCKEYFKISFQESSLMTSWTRIDILLCAMYDDDYKFQSKFTESISQLIN
ncbi:hypothetical protein [Ureibacillus aquaedulcis]|uniref:Uncharacterized protein n=1 Tax=Ureibacillus aquaedulcis TaxID=3058421 RepID=A0ABT8GLI3_9BACL|nr:hypothetical protein [Ureibacillus sp. BA0131]MDN4492151.1 hypothetical protein [Ureibacillus sp. BA0131]